MQPEIKHIDKCFGQKVHKVLNNTIMKHY